MLEQQWTFIDKSNWGIGEWNNEPDKIQWLDEETSLPCLIVRNELGNLCGYVGINKNHIYYEKDSDEFSFINVHGGVNYTHKCGGDICHIVEENEDDNVWWVGFDCAHYYDILPIRYSVNSFQTYKNIEYVKKECKELAQQLKKVNENA